MKIGNHNMKHFTLILIAALVLAGCAHTDKSVSDAFKHRTSGDLLTSGQKALTKKNFGEATKYFEALDSLYPFGKEAEQAHLDIIYAYYKDEDYASALGAVDRYIRLYPQGSHTAYAYYMRGMINFESNKNWLQKLIHVNLATIDTKGLRTAFEDFGQLIDQFPDSKYSADARRQMIYIRNVLAEREIEIAEFYLSKKAYVAAANRASYVVKHIPGTSRTKRALEIMVQAYRALGATQTANDAERMLKNMPLNPIKR